MTGIDDPSSSGHPHNFGEVPRRPGCLALEVLERIRVEAVPRDAAEAARRAEATLHLRECSDCRGRLAEMRETEEFIASFTASLRRRAATSDGHSPTRNAADPAPPIDATGSLRDDFPGYAIESILDVGGQGAIYRARQIATGRVVAIKVPLGDAVSRPGKRYRFRREIELTARLNHPSIVRVLGACEAPDGRIGCVMELVSGTRFDDWAAMRRAEGRAGRRRIVEAVRRLAEAVGYAHQRAVLHRDLKPANVIIDAEGVPRLLDFGLAKALDDDSGSFATATGAFLGTLAHAAPEQVDGWSDGSDVRTDVHGLGLLLYVALAGELPWNAEAPSQEVIRQILDGARRMPTAAAHGADGGDALPDAALDAIVLKAIATSKDRRYSSATALADDLGRWLDGSAVHARLDSRWYRLRKALRRHRRATAIGALALTGLTTLTLLWLESRSAVLRAELTTRVRDAGAVETHWATVADLRASARDNFPLGEARLWDLLIDPEAALLAAGTEGIPALGPPAGSALRLPTSPAYWALWEAYASTPMVASLPTVAPGPILFERSGPLLLESAPEGIRFWNWRTSRIEREIALPEREPGYWHFGMLNANRAIVRSRPGRGFVVELTSGASIPIDLACGTLEGPAEVGLRTLACVRGPLASAPRLEVFDLVGSSLRPRWSRDLPCDVLRMRVDSAEQIVGVISKAGELLVFELATGRELLHRDRTEEPRYSLLHSPGVPGELLVAGQPAFATLRFDGRDATLTAGAAWTGQRAMDDLSLVETSPDGDRYAILTDRSEIRVGQLGRPPSEARVIPSIRSLAATLDLEGRHLALTMRDNPRRGIVDLDSTTVRRLRHRAPATSDGPATIFDCRFTDDGSALLTVAMDGSLRRFAIPRDSAVAGVASPPLGGSDPAGPRRSERIRTTEQMEWFTSIEGEVLFQRNLPGGLMRLAADGDSLFLATHELGRDNACLLRLRDGVATPLLDGSRRWFCGLALQPGVAVWALSGDGRITRLDVETGQIEADRTLSRHVQMNTHRALAHLPGRGVLLAGPGGAGLRVLDDRTLEPVADDVPVSPVFRIVVSPVDPDLFITTHDSGRVMLWRVRDGAPTEDGSEGDTRVAALRIELVREIGSHAGPVMSAAFHPSGRILATGGGSAELRDVRLWDLELGRELAALSLFDNGVFTLAFSPDGRWLAAGGEADRERITEGGQLYLIDLAGPEQCFAGNLEYHLARWRSGHGRDPDSAAALRARFHP